MKKTLLMGILVIGVIGIITGFATYAWFISQASSVDNIFETGELIIGVPNSGGNDAFFTAQNLYPGSSSTRNVQVKNLGDLEFKYRVSAEKSSGDDIFYNTLDILIKKGQDTIYSGKLKDLNILIGTILSGQSESLDFTVSLPSSADNSCQGKMAYIKFIFDATQTGNTDWQ